jgi:membrane protease YdiL (CAAX protease family)
LRPWGRLGACLASGALFAALHLDPVKFLPVGLLGTALALAVWETGSLWPAVVGHGLHNAAVLALVDLSPPAAAPEPLLGVVSAVWLLAAGLGVGAAGLFLLGRRPP